VAVRSADFLAFGEALAKEHGQSALGLSRNEAKTKKDRLLASLHRMATVFLDPLDRPKTSCGSTLKLSLKPKLAKHGFALCQRPTPPGLEFIL
jgi:hypothetical protein